MTSRTTEARSGHVSVVSIALLAIMLFVLGQTAGETVAYMTDGQNVGSNAFTTATVFAPSGVSAAAANTTITVSWTGVGFTVDGYNVYRGTTNGGPYTKVNGSLVTGVSYVDSGLTPGTYYYVVRLVNTRGVESATNSSQVSATADGTLPTSAITAPTNGSYVTSSPFSITGTASDDRAGVTQVEVSTNGGASWQIATGTTSWSYSWVISSEGSYTIQSRATDGAGNVQSPVTSVTVTYDSSGPHVVPPAKPTDGATGHHINRDISVWFSEPMDQATVQSAFSLKQCTTSACTAFSTTLMAPGDGTITWWGAGNNIMRFDASADLAITTWYQISVTTAARDLAGRSLVSGFTSTFQTAGGVASTPPGVTITAPSATTWTNASTYTITGVTGGQIVRAYRDNAPTGSFGGEDTLAATTFMHDGGNDYSLPVPLNTGVANRFVVTATNSANLVSTPAFSSIIYQGDVRTTMSGWGSGAGNTNINVFVPYTGDSNGNNSAKIRWRTPAVGGTYGAQVPMTRHADYFGYTITGLSPSTTYRVEVDVSDADGFASGTAVSTSDITTSGGTAAGLLSGISMDRIRLANRAPQSATLTANVTGSAKFVQFTVQTSGTDKVSACLSPSGGVATFSWDGTNGSGTAEPDGYYTWTATAYPLAASSCTGSSETMSSYIYISNANSIAMSPLPGAVTLGTGESACVTATARNRQGYLVEDGANITFSYSSTPSGGTYTLTQPATGKIGSAASGCTTPAAGTGQAVAKITVDTAVPSMIIMTATMNTQLSGTTATTVSGSTSVNDPPAAPTGLTVSPVSAAANAANAPGVLRSLAPASSPAGGLTARFQAPRQGNVAGYQLLVGTAPGAYTRKIDLGQSTVGTVDGLVPGQRYYVAVQAYNKVKLASAPSAEQVLVAPLDTTVASLDLQPADALNQSVVLPGQPFPVRATARNRAGQPVAGVAVSFTGPRGLTFDPPSGVTGPDGTLLTRVTADASARALSVRSASGASVANLDLPLGQPTVVATATPTTTTVPTSLPSLTPTAMATSVLTQTPTSTVSPSLTATMTLTPASTLTPVPTTTTAPTTTSVPTGTLPPTSTVTVTATATNTATPTRTPTSQPTQTLLPATATMTPVPATATTVLPTATTIPPTATIATPTSVPTASPALTPTIALPTSTTAPTSTAQPTNTAAPTATPLPTNTPVSAATSAGASSRAGR